MKRVRDRRRDRGREREGEREGEREREREGGRERERGRTSAIILLNTLTIFIVWKSVKNVVHNLI